MGHLLAWTPEVSFSSEESVTELYLTLRYDQPLLSYPPTQVLIDTLSKLAKTGNPESSLVEVAKAVASENPNFALDLFVSTRSGDRDRVLSESGEKDVDRSAFDQGRVYSTHTTFQYKTMLYHVGLLIERGTETKLKLDPTTDVWALETRTDR